MIKILRKLPPAPPVCTSTLLCSHAEPRRKFGPRFKTTTLRATPNKQIQSDSHIKHSILACWLVLVFLFVHLTFFKNVSALILEERCSMFQKASSCTEEPTMMKASSWKNLKTSNKQWVSLWVTWIGLPSKATKPQANWELTTTFFVYPWKKNGALRIFEICPPISSTSDFSAGCVSKPRGRILFRPNAASLEGQKFFERLGIADLIKRSQRHPIQVASYDLCR